MSAAHNIKIMQHTLITISEVLLLPSLYTVHPCILYTSKTTHAYRDVCESWNDDQELQTA